MDLISKKSCQTMALMLHWPMLLTAMGVWDLPHLASTTPADYGDLWSHLAETHDLSLNQNDGSLIEQIYATTAGQDHPDVFNSPDGFMDNWWSGDEGREQHSMFQEVGDETLSHPFLSASQISSPRHDIHDPSLPQSDAHTDMLGEWSRLEDLSENDEWNVLDAQKSPSVLDSRLEALEMLRKASPQHEHEHAHHRNLFQDDVFEGLANLGSIPPLGDIHHYHSAHTSSSPAKSYDDFTTIGSPGGGTTLYEATNSMPHLDSFFPSSFPIHSPGGALHNEDFQPKTLDESATRIRGEPQAHEVMEALLRHDHIQNPPAFSNTPGPADLSQSSSDYRILDEDLIRSPEPHAGHDLGISHNFENFLESPTFHGERRPISHDSSHLYPLSVGSPVSSEPENFEKYFDHLPHGTSHNKPMSPISETKKGSDRSPHFSRYHPMSLDATLHELDSIPHFDDLPSFGEFSMDRHMHFSAISEPRIVSSERTLSGFLESEARKDSKAASNKNLDDTASSKLAEWRNNRVQMDWADSGEQNLDQDRHITISQNPELPFQDAPDSSIRPGQLKRPSQTLQVNSRPSKRKSPHDPFSFDEDDRSISQAKQVFASKATQIHTADSSTVPSQQTSWVPIKPRPTLGFGSGTISGFERLGDHATVPKTFDQTHSKDMAIEKESPAPSPYEKLNEATTAYSEKIRELHSSLRFTGTSPQEKVKLNTANHQSLSSRDLIDRFQPQISDFMNSILKHEPNVYQSSHLIDNLEMLWDNYLEMIASCSQLISSKRISTNLEQDLLDAQNWILEEWKDIPTTRFNWWPARAGAVHPPGKALDELAFVEKFSSAATRSIHAGTVFWLSHAFYNQRREHVATFHVMRFMRDKRENWIHWLKPKRAKVLSVRTLLTKMKKVKPLKYPSARVKDSSNGITGADGITSGL